MSTNSTDGREWARFSTLKAGDKVRADGGFTCITDGAILTVHCDRHGIYVRCRGSEDTPWWLRLLRPFGERHYVDGRLGFDDDDADSMIRLWPA